MLDVVGMKPILSCVLQNSTGSAHKMKVLELYVTYPNQVFGLLEGKQLNCMEETPQLKEVF